VGVALLGGASSAQAATKAKPQPTPTPTVTPPPPPTDTAAWTVMVYLDGDNNLEKYVTLDIENELCALGSNADVNVVTLADRAPGYDRARGDWTTTKLFYCWQGMLADAASAVADWGERDMGDPGTLVDFVNHCRSIYPAEHYLLVFWDHGYCWYPEGWIISDETSLDTLDLDEQMAALGAVGGVDAIGCDQCQMQMIEVAACYQPYATAVTASEETVGYTGLNFIPLIEALRADPAMTAEQVADNLAANAQGSAQTWSSLALDARFDALRAAVDQWALALIDGLPAYRGAYEDAEKKMTRFVDPSEVDLWDAANEIKLTVDDPVIDARCDAVMSAVDDAVTVNWTRKRKLEARGVAITWARDIDDLVWRTSVDDWGYYRTVLPFSLQTNWDEFLAAYTAGT
jgi:hypothetical protein